MMKRSLLAIAVGSLSLSAYADNAVTVSGFTDITYTNATDTSVFLANAEVDIEGKTENAMVRIDYDLAIGLNGGNNINAATPNGPADSGIIEQAYFAYSGLPMVTVIGGVFNNPIGWEAEDAPDMYQITKGQIYKILDSQTALYGNNIAGVAAAIDLMGMGSITLAGLNDISLQNSAGATSLEENSIAAVVNLTPMKGLGLEVGYVTQQANAGNVYDVNATYSNFGATVGLEYLGAENVVDSAIGATLNYMLMDKLGATVRYETISYEAGGDDTTSVTAAISYALAKNVTVLAEYTDVKQDFNTVLAGAGADSDAINLEFVATF